MPPNRKCPACGMMVPDWHFEWHTQEDQKAIYAGKASMQCPFCSAGIAFDGFAVAIGEQGRPLAKRDILKAARWAWNYAKNSSLLEYLQTEEDNPYKDFWHNSEVQAADKSVAAEQE